MARERKKSKGNASGLLSIWNDAIIEYYGKDRVIAPTGKVLGSLKTACKRLPISDDPAKLKAFIEHVVQNWKQVKAKQFKNYANYPEFPITDFFVRNIAKYYDDYCNPVTESIQSDKPRIRILEKENDDLKETIRKLRIENAETKRALALLRKKLDRMKRNGGLGAGRRSA